MVGLIVTAMTAGLTLAAPAGQAAPVPLASTLYEAEQATITNGLIETNHAGFTGTGFVNYANAVGSAVQWTVNVPATGSYQLVLRYANGTAVNRPLDIAVNGTVRTPNVPFTGTGAWTSWRQQIVQLPLTAGTSTIRATATTAEGGPNLDSLTVGDEAPPTRDWSVAMVDSTMARHPATSLTLAYDQALFLYGTYLVYQRTRDARYLNYVKAWGNSKVAADGSTAAGGYNDLDNMLAGNIYLILHRETGENRYRLAAQRIWNRLNGGGYPKTADGGFWHATWFPDQLWADGVFMSQPFVIRYGVQYNVAATGYAVSTTQLITYFNRLRNANGLLNHAYDQRKTASWANRQTGVSPEVWCRAVGWFGLTAIDILELLPADHPNRAAVLDILRHIASGYQRFQDPVSGRWFQLAAKPTLAGNWTETSCSSMATFTLSRGIERGYLDASYQPAVNRGYQGVLAKVSVGTDGRTNLTDIVVGTGPGNQASYLSRPRATNDFHGLGAFLIMNEQLIRRPPTE